MNVSSRSALEEMSPAATRRDVGAALPSSFRVRTMVEQWLQSDVPSFDVGGFVVGNDVRVAHVLAKSPCVVAGVAFAKVVFDYMGLEHTWNVEDGDVVTPEQAQKKLVVAVVKGPARDLLLAERTALNVLSRASGIASETNALVELVRSAGWEGHVAATRKTTPGFGLVEKYAVLVGGGSSHRMDLSQMTMLKDNHVWSVGSISKAVAAAKELNGFSSKVEVEVRDYDEAIEACESGADVVMLDNYTPERIRAECPRLKARFPHVVIEASGGITAETVVSYVHPSMDVVSIGRLTQGYGCKDFSMKIQRDVAKL